MGPIPTDCIPWYHSNCRITKFWPFMFPTEFYMTIHVSHWVLCYHAIAMIPWYTIGWNGSHDGWVFNGKCLFDNLSESDRVISWLCHEVSWYIMINGMFCHEISSNIITWHETSPIAQEGPFQLLERSVPLRVLPSRCHQMSWKCLSI